VTAIREMLKCSRPRVIAIGRERERMRRKRKRKLTEIATTVEEAG